MSTRSANVALIHLAYLDEDGRPQCPACSSYRVREQRLRGVHSVGDQVQDCLACGAVFGTFAKLDDSYQHVHDTWCRCKARGDDDQRYFDFTGLRPRPLVHRTGEATFEKRRRHGWYHPACGRLTQVG